ncbi:MAG: hypothetical protein R3Y57_03315 [Erysipelotrichaceae bacterium]
MNNKAKNLLFKNVFKEISFNLMLSLLLVAILIFQGNGISIILVFLGAVILYIIYTFYKLQNFLKVLNSVQVKSKSYCVIDSIIVTDTLVIDCSKKYKMIKIDEIEMIVYLESAIERLKKEEYAKKNISIVKKEQVINTKVQTEKQAQLLVDYLYTINSSIYLNNITFEKKRSFKEFSKIGEQ